ncbi:unnamed protein product [Saccharomyces cerevisiae]|nr:unnamed protein product [Saccharomyces cerevisiae]
MFIDICDKVLQTNAAYEKNTKIREYKLSAVEKHMLSCHHFVNYTSNGVCTTNTIYTLEHDDEYLLFLTAQPQMLQCVPKVPAPRFAKIN